MRAFGCMRQLRASMCEAHACMCAQVVREADGYQAHLVSPEAGLRRLVDEAIGLVLEPVNMCVRRVHQVLLDAARCACSLQCPCAPPPGAARRITRLVKAVPGKDCMNVKGL